MEVLTQAELQQWFEKFDADNPQYYEAFVKLSKEMRDEGHRRYGAKTIMERLRWESEVRDPSKKYKLSNDIKDRLTARFARKLMKEEPTFAGFFRIKPLNDFFSPTNVS